MPKKPDLTVAEYLAHMGQAVVQANILSMKTLMDAVENDGLDAKVPIGGVTVNVDGTVITPEGWFGLDELEIECESAVHVARDGDGNPTGLAMSMTKGLFNKGMHVRFRAKYTRQGLVEGIEILRAAGNQALQQAINGTRLRVNINQKDGE